MPEIPYNFSNFKILTQALVPMLLAATLHSMEQESQKTNLESRHSLSLPTFETQDPLTALKKIDDLIALQPIPVQALLLRNLLNSPSFLSKVEVLVNKIKPLFETVSVATLSQNLRIIEKLLAGFSPMMRTFLINYFRACHVWLAPELTTIAEYTTPGHVISNIHFLSKKASAQKVSEMEPAADVVYIIKDSEQHWRLSPTMPNLQTKCIVSIEKENDHYFLRVRRNNKIINQVRLESPLIDCFSKIDQNPFPKLSRTKLVSAKGDPIFSSDSYQVVLKLSHNKNVVAIGIATGNNAGMLDLKSKRMLTLYFIKLRETGVPLVQFEQSFSRVHPQQLLFPLLGVLEDITIEKMVFSHQDELICICSNYGYCLQRIATKETITQQWNVREANNTEQEVFSSAAFTHDDLMLLIAGQKLRFFNARDGSLLFMLAFANEPRITALNFSSDDLCLALAFGKKVCIWQKDALETLFFKKATIQHQTMVNSLGKSSFPFLNLEFAKKARPSEKSQKALIDIRERILVRNKQLFELRKRAELQRAKVEPASNQSFSLSYLDRVETYTGLAPGKLGLAEDIRVFSPELLQLPAYNTQKAYTCLAIDGEGMQDSSERSDSYKA